MRVLMVNKFHYLRGGSETYHFTIAEGLRELGHQVAFFAMDDPKNMPCEQSPYFVSNVDYGVEHGLIDSAKSGISLVYSYEAREKFNALVDSFRPDVIHLNLVHRQITFSILDAPAARGIPVVYTAHDYIPVCPNCTFLDSCGEICEDCLGGSFRPCARKHCVKNSKTKSILAVVEAEFLRAHGSYGKVDQFIAPSEFMKSKLAGGGIPSAKIKVMRNFSSQEQAEGLEARSCKGDYFLYAGRLSPEKDLDTLIVGFAHAVDMLPAGSKLVIVGDGPDRFRLQKAVETSSCFNRIKFLGHVDHEEVTSLLKGASASVITSKCYENAPYSIIEAFSLGVPVIGSRIGGIAELVRDGSTGFTFKVGDYRNLAGRMLEIASMSDETYEAMSRNCISFAQDELSKSKYLDELVNMYRSLMERKGCVSRG